MRWFRYVIYAFSGAAVLLAAAVAWFVLEVRSQLDVAAERTGPADGILAWAEPAPEAHQAGLPDIDSRSLDLQQLEAPPVSARPWARWWWPGGDVSSQAACEQLERLYEQGFGGVEIQAFNAGLQAVDDAATLARINSFDNDDWYQTLGEFMQCAWQLGVAVYLNHLSGWPAGGPQVALADGLWTLRFAETIISGGDEVQLDLPLPRPSVNDYLMALAEFFIDMELAGFAVEQREIVAVLAARVVGGQRGANPLDATDTLQLESGSVQVLTERVVEGELHWRPPAGEWVIIAVYLMPSAEAPTLVAGENPGYVIDHLDSDKLRAHYDYAYGSRTGLNAHYGKAFAGFFNDSLEFKLDRLASVDILEAFAERRGYDLAPHLPAIFVDAYDSFFIRDVGRTRSAPSFSLDDTDARIRHDYQLTLSDLVIERFAQTSADWAKQRKLRSRGQTYGFEMDTIRALGANHIPETEHLWGSSSEYVMKLAGAAGLLYDRPLVSAESFVWLKRAYAVTPRHIKAGADLLFLSGVNQVIYHGVPFTSEEQAYRDTFGWLGWYPFQGPGNPSGFSGNYGPNTPVWEVLPELNAYIARSQQVLQAGKPAVDVLVYYPFLGFPKSIEDSAVAGDALLFGGLFPGEPPVKGEGVGAIPFVKFLPDDKDPRLAWLEKLIPTLQALDARGITWSWVNGHALQAGKVNPGDFRALLIADVATMPVATVEALLSLSEKGQAIYFMDDLPTRQPGFADYERGDAWVAQRAAALAAGRTVADASELASLVAPALAIDGGTRVRRVSRRGAAGDEYHLLVNRSLATVSASLSLPEEAVLPAYWFDAASGALWPAQTSGGAYELSLGPLESRFLLFTDQVRDDYREPLSVQLAAEKTSREALLELDGEWKITGAGANASAAPPFPEVRALPYLDGAPVELLYETSFDLPERYLPGRFLLSLGEVAGIARLELNGAAFAPQSFDPFVFDVSAAVRSGANQLRLKITPPLRNSLVSSEGLMDKAMAQFQEQIGAVGLGGPVRLYRLPTVRTTQITKSEQP